MWIVGNVMEEGMKLCAEKFIDRQNVMVKVPT